MGDAVELLELGRRLDDGYKGMHTRRDLLRLLDAFLDAVLARGNAGYAIGQEVLVRERFKPFHIHPNLFTTSNLQLMRDVRDAYRDPRRLVAADRLKRFYDLALPEEYTPLPVIFEDGTRKAAWFYGRQPGYWATVRGNLLPSDNFTTQTGLWTTPTSAMDPPSLTIARILPRNLAFYRNLMRTVRTFGADHEFTRHAVRRLIRDIELENGRIISPSPSSPPGFGA
jgi:hypothetical protein